MGQSINPQIDLGQVEGAFIQGLGYMTMEEFLFACKYVDGKPVRTGKAETTGLSNYKIPGITDIPVEFNVHLLQKQYNDKITYGAKGVGEPPLCLGVCVMMAIRNAVGGDTVAPATI